MNQVKGAGAVENALQYTLASNAAQPASANTHPVLVRLEAGPYVYDVAILVPQQHEDPRQMAVAWALEELAEEGVDIQVANAGTLDGYTASVVEGLRLLEATGCVRASLQLVDANWVECGILKGPWQNVNVEYHGTTSNIAG